MHINGRGCLAYHKRCYTCNKRDNFAMVCRSKRYMKERTITNHRIKSETNILKKTELESRRQEESDYKEESKTKGRN